MKHYKHELRSISELIPYINNSRTHSDGQVLQITASIKEFGFTNPVLVDEQGGVIAGHGRIMAAKKLGIEQVPCIVLDGLTEAQKKAYVIADNQLALNAGWDSSLLKLEIETLQDFGFDIDLLGFDDGFLDELLLGHEEGDGDENIYSGKIETPIYEPTDEKPSISELVDTSKSLELIDAISDLDAPDDVKQFLIYAARRHDKFNFKKIAHYYANCADECIKSAMESSALVIIDYEQAIEAGFIKMTKDLAAMTGEGDDKRS